ncbi:MAG: dTDP-glucose 4,6-dehydratase [Proteobacteria bacterium]|nr:dTDP-glucose 4,6-dehydratase [Pseudomonadota bacterium]
MRPLANLLVTGGAGFIGSAFIRRVLAAQPAMKIVDLDVLTYAGNLDNLADVDPARHVFVRGDIADGALIERLVDEHRIDTIVHFAAESHVDRSIHGPAEFIQTNVLGTMRLLDVVRARPSVHFHHISTDEVYGSLPLGEGVFTEATPYQPNSPYAASKAASDHLVRAWARTYKLSVTTSHASNNYGPYQFPEKLIPLMIANCIEGKPLPVYGDGKNVRDWLHVDDHADAVWEILQRGASGEVYDVGGGNEWANLDLVHCLCDQFAAARGEPASKYRGLITFVTDRPGHDLRYAIAGDKIADQLGWRPKYDFETGLRATIDWYLANPTWIARVKTGAYREWITKHYGA